MKNSHGVSAQCCLHLHQNVGIKMNWFIYTLFSLCALRESKV